MCTDRTKWFSGSNTPGQPIQRERSLRLQLGIPDPFEMSLFCGYLEFVRSGIE